MMKIEEFLKVCVKNLVFPLQLGLAVAVVEVVVWL